uniref:Uncharacterized protein n=1 Tax=Anopheles atroparvus TaxID=41427 RepID=A0A182IQ06_ANOAO
MHDTDHGRSAADRCGLRFTTVVTLEPPPPATVAGREGLESAVAIAVELPPFESVATPSSSFETSQVATELASPSELSVSRAIESESVYSPEASQSVVGTDAGRIGAATGASNGCFSNHSCRCEENECETKLI